MNKIKFLISTLFVAILFTLTSCEVEPVDTSVKTTTPDDTENLNSTVVPVILVKSTK